MNFLRLFLWFILRHILANRCRTLTVLLGVALGASVFTTVRLAMRASIDSFDRTMTLLAGHADHVVTRPGGRLPERLVGEILKIPGVETASPTMSAYVVPEKVPGEFPGKSPGKYEDEPFRLMAFAPILDRPLREWDVAEAESEWEGPWLDLLREPGTLVMGRKLANLLSVSKGETLPLSYIDHRADFRVAGIFEEKGLALAEGGQFAITDIATFQEFTRLFGVVDRIDIKLRPGHPENTLARIRAALPPGAKIQKPSVRREGGNRMIRAYELNLSVLSFVSLFVGMFLVYSLVALNAASRRREIAILRSVGASARTVFQLFLCEGVAFGLLGWLLAIPVGAVMVRYMLGSVSQTISTLFLRVRPGELALNPWEMMISLGLTIVVSVLAAWQPAYEAMRVRPSEAMMMIHTQGERRSFFRMAVAGLLLVALVWPVSLLPGWRGFPLPAYLAVFMLFLGFALLSPWGLRQLGETLSPVLRRWFGEPAGLAAHYLRDSGLRTAISVGALITAVALFAALVIMVHSFRQTVEIWVNQSISGDLFIRPKMAELNQYQDPLSETTVRAVKSLPMKAEPLPYFRTDITYNGHPYIFEALDLPVFFKHGTFEWTDGDPASARPKLAAGKGVVISEVFATHTGLTTGDRYQTTIRSANLDLPVLGVVRDYRTSGGVVFCDLNGFFARTGDPEPVWKGVRIFFGDGIDPRRGMADVKRALADCCLNELELTFGPELRGNILEVFDQTFAITTVLLIIALVVAALGIATTLTVMVLERTRQFNTLFAVGASVGQIRAIIFWEALLMAMAGEVAGVCCGFILSALLIFVINLKSFGWTFLYSVDLQALAASLPLIVLAALVSAIPALRQLFREPPATLLRER